MYVPGTLNDVEHVLVDVGTGYYVEKVSIKYIYYNLTKCCFVDLIFMTNLKSVSV